MPKPWDESLAAAKAAGYDPKLDPDTISWRNAILSSSSQDSLAKETAEATAKALKDENAELKKKLADTETELSTTKATVADYDLAKEELAKFRTAEETRKKAQETKRDALKAEIEKLDPTAKELFVEIDNLDAEVAWLEKFKAKLAPKAPASEEGAGEQEQTHENDTPPGVPDINKPAGGKPADNKQYSAEVRRYSEATGLTLATAQQVLQQNKKNDERKQAAK